MVRAKQLIFLTIAFNYFARHRLILSKLIDMPSLLCVMLQAFSGLKNFSEITFEADAGFIDVMDAQSVWSIHIMCKFSGEGRELNNTLKVLN